MEGFHGNRRVGSKERIHKERENKREGIREDSIKTMWRDVSAEKGKCIETWRGSPSPR